MPVYNAMPYLPEAVRSIFAQTISDWELIIVDDGSTDGSSEYLSRINDSRVRIHTNAKNGGVSLALNRAVAMATGRYIARMDGDDISLPRRLEAQLAMLEGNRELDAVGTGLIRTTQDLQVVEVRRLPVSHREITRIIRCDKSFIHGPSFDLTGGAIMGRKEWLQRWPFEVGKIDFTWFCRSFRESTFGNVRDPLYIYRRGGVTGTWWRQVVSCRTKAEFIARYCFFPGNRVQAVLALVSAALRPLTAAAVYTALSLSRGKAVALSQNVPAADRALLADALEQLARCEVPLRAVQETAR
jgi:glycosyltransferase involved in cell wall biosynthesis